MWDSCKLRYYYNYIGKWEGYKGDILRERLHWLSKKSNSWFLEGQLVHQAIESQVAQHSLGRPVSKEAAQRLFRFQLKRITENPHAFIVEMINGTDVPDGLFEATEEEGIDLLEIFFEIIWPNYEKFGYEQHERFERFKIDDILVYVKIDLVSTMDDGTVIVTDWKTGKMQELGKEQQRQILVYLLWAMSRYGVPHDRVKAEIRPLRFPEKHLIHEPGAEEIEDLREYILENAGAMLAVESEEDFPASPSQELCQHCNFATICPEGMNFLSVDKRQEPIIPGQIEAT